jgi:hypothetical protein
MEGCEGLDSLFLARSHCAQCARRASCERGDDLERRRQMTCSGGGTAARDTAEEEAAHRKRRCEMTTPGFMRGVRMMQPDSRMKEIEYRNNDSPIVTLRVVTRVRATGIIRNECKHTLEPSSALNVEREPMAVHDSALRGVV